MLIYDAIAYISGSSLAPRLRGTVKFKKRDNGSWVYAEVSGLPPYQPATDKTPQVAPFGFHIHAGKVCGENYTDSPFTAAGEHWNPDNQPHGNHAGDLPALFSNNGIAKMYFFTNRFTPEQVIGKTIVIHQSPDDYMAQPSGGSGKRIGCGTITAF